MLRSASDEAARMKEASARAMDELRRTLQQSQGKVERLVGELAMRRQEIEARDSGGAGGEG